MALCPVARNAQFLAGSQIIIEMTRSKIDILDTRSNPSATGVITVFCENDEMAQGKGKILRRIEHIGWLW